MNAGETTPPADGVWGVTGPGVSVCHFTTKDLCDAYVAREVERHALLPDSFSVDEWVVFDRLPEEGE
jgi:hypothetical protein